jgi:hypothetical protein
MQGAPQAGSQQRADADTDAGAAAAQRAGIRVVEHPADAAEPAEVDESYFRDHYSRIYAGGADSYEDYAPAYQYGANMANSETYRGRAWKDVEPQLRSDWEGRNPDSTWEKFKAAVRHGWDRIAHG